MSFRSVLSLCKTEPRRAWTWAKVSSLYVLLQDFSDLFTKGTDDLGSTDLITHTINTGDAQPLRQAPRSVPLAMRGLCPVRRHPIRRLFMHFNCL